MIERERVELWLGRRPGVFESPTEREVWEKAWSAFSGLSIRESAFLDFTLVVRAAGFEVRGTTLGGFILDTTL